MASDDDGNADPRRGRGLPARRTGSTRSGSPGGSAASPTARPSPTAARSATACSPSRWSSCSASSPRPERRAVAGGGVVREPARHRLRRRVWDEMLLGFGPPDDTVPDDPRGAVAVRLVRRPAGVPGAVQGGVAADDRPSSPPTSAYRRLYYYLHKMVDQAIGRILDALDASGMADDTIVVFTSDHGDLLGAHGGLQQKWCNAFDEAIRVPLLVKGPGVARTASGITTPTSHVDLIPTLLGLAGIDVETRRRRRRRAPRRGPAAARPRPQRPHHRHRRRRRRSRRRCTS